MSDLAVIRNGHKGVALIVLVQIETNIFLMVNWLIILYKCSNSFQIIKDWLIALPRQLTLLKQHIVHGIRPNYLGRLGTLCDPLKRAILNLFNK